MDLSMYDPKNVLCQTTLHYAIRHMDDEDRLIDIASTKDVHAKDLYQMTPLYYAVERGFVRLIRCLLRHGASCTTLNIYEETPLMYARYYCSTNPSFPETVLVLSFREKMDTIRFKIRLVGALICMYRKSCENVYKPMGVGYWQAREEYDRLIHGH